MAINMKTSNIRLPTPAELLGKATRAAAAKVTAKVTALSVASNSKAEDQAPHARPQPLNSILNPLGHHAERMRGLRNQILMLMDPAASGGTIAIVSANSGDGRSRLTAELALSFAQLRIKTLLVDADMRNPSQHQIFRSRNTVSGLAEALVTGATPVARVSADYPSLSIITAGVAPQNSLDLLSDGRFARLAREWRRNYRFVLIDTPPLSLFADGLSIARTAGRSLIVTRAEHSTLEGSKQMLRHLATTRTEVLGAVLNHH